MVPSAGAGAQDQRQLPAREHIDEKRVAGQRHHQPARALRSPAARPAGQASRRDQWRCLPPPPPDAARPPAASDRLPAAISTPDSARHDFAVGFGKPRLHRLPVDARPASPASAGANTVLPMPVSVPVTTKLSRLMRHFGGQIGEQRVQIVRRRHARSARCAAAPCLPARWADGWRGCHSRAPAAPRPAPRRACPARQ